MEKQKHVFFVHSAITYLVACEVIALKQLPEEQLLFLTHRGFKVPQPKFKSHVFPYSWSPEPFPFKINFLKSWERVRQFDRFIDKLTHHSSYIIYLPHSSFRVLKLLISHPRCKGYAYLEEGLSSYNRIEQVNKPPYYGSVHPLDRLLNRNRIPDRFFFNQHYEAVYGLHEEVFPDFEKRVVLQSREGRRMGFPADYEKRHALQQYDGAHILVLDAISVYGAVKREVHLYAFLKMLKTLEAAGIRQAYIKYHPAQIDMEESALFRKTASLFSQTLGLTEIEQEVSLEVVAQTCTAVTFYVNLSSVGLYAAKAGQSVYSWAPYLMELDDEYRQRFYEINQVFLDTIHLLGKKGIPV